MKIFFLFLEILSKSLPNHLAVDERGNTKFWSSLTRSKVVQSYYLIDWKFCASLIKVHRLIAKEFDALLHNNIADQYVVVF